MKYNRKEIEPKIKEAIENTKSLAEANRKYFPEMNIKTFKKLAKEFGVFKPNQSHKDCKISDFPNRYEIGKEKFLKDLENNKFCQSNKLREKLFRYELKEKRCEICFNTEWNGLEIPLEVHHRDGDKFNNVLDNLMIICPNCHAQTETYKSKNKTYKNARVVE